MKKLVACAFMLIAAVEASAVEDDKMAHFGVAAGAGFATDSLLFWVGPKEKAGYRIAAASGVPLMACVWKEASDDTGWGWQDLAAGAVGIAVGVGFSEVTHRKLYLFLTDDAVGVRGTF